MSTVQKITFLGIGNVGFALADNLVNLGHTVTVAARDLASATVHSALERNPRLTAQSVTAAVAAADIVFLATPFPAAEAALLSAGSLSGKIVVDCTNPVGPGLSHGLNNTLSGGEFLQNLVPAAHVVKAFSIYGFENFENSSYAGHGDLQPVMLLAGNDSVAKQTVGDLCRQLGWEPMDSGPISMSLHLEHLALLWIKMARVQGLGAGFVWAMLRR